MTSGKISRLALLVLGAGLLSGCTMTGPANLRVHEVNIYGAGAQRLAWVYGDLGGAASSSVKIGGQAVTLRAQVSDPLATPGSLSVDGKAAYVAKAGSLAPRFTLARESSGAFTVTSLAPAGQVQTVYYTDGTNWQRLSSVTGTALGAPVSGLRGAGQLTDAEADALTRALSNQGALAVAVLSPAATLPDAALNVEPRPSEQRRTALYVLGSAQIALSGTTTTSTTTTTVITPAPTSPTSGGRVNFSEVASGTNANTAAAGVLLARTASEARALYATAYGRQTGIPTPPALAAGETLVGVFMGQRPTGGYSVRVTGATGQGSTLALRVQVNAPGPGAITTQALTSPWTIVRVSGSFSAASVLDQLGQPLRGPGGNDR
ncbi:PrcB C-terminal [Deinococcus reticulitermitis]|uniref:PrcB C-terminal n=1 Tax=Deinococcus reticulitermitis TaxID=856736 RepID=A0A1H7APL2_9DEIO|nr:protease complex subunit PrcB family protein [Deinococcus reticulitermitis]SEJ62965.1 PrcB C-terminal [Deinococcus reticulitermitis]